MSSQTVWLPTALYTALIRLQMDDFTTTECLNAVFGESEYNQVHIPADHEHQFRFNVNTISGPM